MSYADFHEANVFLVQLMFGFLLDCHIVKTNSWCVVISTLGDGVVLSVRDGDMSYRNQGLQCKCNNAHVDIHAYTIQQCNDHVPKNWTYSRYCTGL